MHGSTGGQDLTSIERKTAEAFGLDEVGLRALMDDVWEEYIGVLNLELVDYFRALRPRYKTEILSNSFVGAREREHHAHRLADTCDVIVYSHEEGCRKPDPEIYRITSQRLDTIPEAAVFLDDLQENVDGARTVGINAICFHDNTQAISELDALLAGNSA